MSISTLSSEKTPLDPLEGIEGVVLELAEDLLRRANQAETSAQKRQLAQTATLIEEPAWKRIVVSMTDLFWRSDDPARITRIWRSLLHKFGPSCSRSTDLRLMQLGAAAAGFLPALVIALVRQRL